MKVAHASKNMSVGIIITILTQLISFAVRTALIFVLVPEYLGLNGLFANILQILSIAELGFTSAIIYSLYKPVSRGETQKIKALIGFLRRVYLIVALIILITGLAAIPLLRFLVGDTTIAFREITFLYAVFLTKSLISYFTQHKRVIINVHQEQRIEALNRFAFFFVMSGICVTVLFLTRSFLWYAVAALPFLVLENIFITLIANKRYPHLRGKAEKLAKDEKKPIMQNVSALVTHKVGGIVLNGTDSIIISAFLGLVVMGVFSNYLLVITMLITMFTVVTQSFTAGVGITIAEGDNEKVYKVFKRTRFLLFWLVAVAAVCLLVLFQPFITLWTNEPETFLLYYPTVILMVVNFYIFSLRHSIFPFQIGAALFKNDRYKPIFEVAIRISLAIILLHFTDLGISAVFIASIVSQLIACFWLEPYITYKHLFKKPLRNYFLFFGVITAITAASSAAVYFLLRLIPVLNFGTFIAMAIIAFIMPNVILFMCLGKTKEFAYMRGLLFKILGKIKNKEVKKEENMIFNKTKIDGVVEVELKSFGDNRGWFSETYKKELFDKNGLQYDFIQDNHSYSKDSCTLRGLHLQNAPYAQAKLVRCVRGSIFDVAVDLRTNSSTYKQWVGVELSAENKKMLMIPRGFAHGFITLEPDTEVCYKVDNVYHKDSEVGIIYNDAEIGIDWNVEEPILSDKDKAASPLSECVIIFDEPKIEGKE